MITGIDHATIATARLDETRDFFVDILGLEVGYRPDFGAPGVWLYGGGRPILHLAVRESEPAAGGVIDHFSFAVDDMAATLARLDRAGVKYVHVDFPDGQGSQAFCRDPNGAVIELTRRDHPDRQV